MKGRIAVLDRINGREAAALLVDGRLEDLLISPPDDQTLRAGAIYRAVADRPVKGQNGMMLRLGGGQKAFLRQARGIAPGQRLLVQISSTAESGKAPPAVTRLLFKGRFAILTPGAPGLNIARSIRDEALREKLAELANEAMFEADPEVGLILRSAAALGDADDILTEIDGLRATCQAVLSDPAGSDPELLLDAPGAHYLAWRDWSDPPPDQVFDAATRAGDSFADHGVFELIDQLCQPFVPLGGNASMFVEPTRALVAVDVNTGGDFSFSAGLKANLAAARDLPRQLRARGLGGQIVIDFAPMGKKDRRSIEQALNRALRQDRIETSIVGWTPLGHLELQRKRERPLLSDLLADV